MNDYDNFFPNFDKYEQVWTSLDKFRHVWSRFMSRKIFLGGGGWQSLILDLSSK